MTHSLVCPKTWNEPKKNKPSTYGFGDTGHHAAAVPHPPRDGKERRWAPQWFQLWERGSPGGTQQTPWVEEELRVWGDQGGETSPNSLVRGKSSAGRMVQRSAGHALQHSAEFCELIHVRDELRLEKKLFESVIAAVLVLTQSREQCLLPSARLET